MDAPTTTSPMAQEDVDGLRCQVEALRDELERLRHERKQSSDAVREQVEVWLQCRGEECQTLVFEKHAAQGSSSWPRSAMLLSAMPLTPLQGG